MYGKTNKSGVSRSKRREIIKEVLCEDESNKDSDEEDLAKNVYQQLFEKRKAYWNAVFEKYESITKESLNTSEDVISFTSNNELLEDDKPIRPIIKVKNWLAGFDSIPDSSKDISETLAAVHEAPVKNEDVGTVQNMNPTICENPSRKSSFMFKGASKISKMKKMVSVKKNVTRHEYQLRSRRKREVNSEKQRGDDISQDFISNDIFKELKEHTSERSKPFQNTKVSEKLHQNESLSIDDVCNEGNNKVVDTEKQEQVKSRKDQTIRPIPTEIHKENSNRDLKCPNDNSENISQDSPNIKLNTSLNVTKQNRIMKNDVFPNSVHHSLSFLNFSIDSKNEDTIMMKDEFSVQSLEKERETSEWNTEYSNFIKYHLKDFRKNPGSMLFPLPKLKPFGGDKKLSWESIINGN